MAPFCITEVESISQTSSRIGASISSHFPRSVSELRHILGLDRLSGKYQVGLVWANPLRQ